MAYISQILICKGHDSFKDDDICTIYISLQEKEKWNNIV